MSRPTRDDVAKLAGVSGWTVSNVLSGKPNSAIREETRQRVLEAARQVNYRPNSNARALVTGKFHTIGFWMCFDYSQHRSHVLHRMQQLMKVSGYEIVIRDIEREVELDPSFSKTFQLPVDGIIALDTPTAGSAFSHVNPHRSIPFVSMGGYWAPEQDYVGVDLYAGTVEAIKHLITTGRRNIAYLSPMAEKNWPIDMRMAAYTATLHEAGMDSNVLWMKELSLSNARRDVRQYLTDAPGQIDAIFCHNDDIAFGAYRAMIDLGIRVGHDIALIGCDGIEEGDYLACPLTTIAQPVDEMCELAWKFLQRRMEEPDCEPQQRLLKPQLIVRASTQ